MGEPLVHPRIAEMCAYLTQRHFFPALSSNGILLDQEMSERLIDSGVVWLQVSLDKPSAEEYKTWRRNARYGQIVENINTFLAVRDRRGKRIVFTLLFIVPWSIARRAARRRCRRKTRPASSSFWSRRFAPPWPSRSVRSCAGPWTEKRSRYGAARVPGRLAPVVRHYGGHVDREMERGRHPVLLGPERRGGDRKRPEGTPRHDSQQAGCRSFATACRGVM